MAADGRFFASSSSSADPAVNERYQIGRLLLVQTDSRPAHGDRSGKRTAGRAARHRSLRLAAVCTIAVCWHRFAMQLLALVTSADIRTTSYPKLTCSSFRAAGADLLASGRGCRWVACMLRLALASADAASFHGMAGSRTPWFIQ